MPIDHLQVGLSSDVTEFQFEIDGVKTTGRQTVLTVGSLSHFF